MEYLFNGIVATLATVVLSAVVGAILRRILGGQPARWRAFVVALVAVVVVATIAVPIANALGWDTAVVDAGDIDVVRTWLLVMIVSTIGIGVGALGLLVLWEAVVPTGRWGGFLDIARGIWAGAKRGVRYLSLAWIAATSGLWAVAGAGPESPKFAAALVRTLSRSGPTFVKIGQVLSTRTEFIAPELAKGLATLQSDAPPVPAAEVERIITSAWGRPPGEVLATFDPQPFAAASLAQVNVGTLRPDGPDGGMAVVIKVQRPGADQRVRVDADILRRFARGLDQRFGWAKRMGVTGLADGLTASLVSELDYREEARNARLCAQVLRDEPRIVVPAVVDDLSGDRVIVMQRLSGSSVASAAAQLEPAARRELAEMLLQRVALGVFADGVFHADLHPGNILLLDDGRIGLLDFGAIGVIDQETRRLLAMLLLAVLSGDNLAATTALTLAFDVSDEHSRDALQRDLGRLMTLHLSGTPDLNALVVDLFSFLTVHGVAVPGDVAAAFRTIASLQGTIDALDPDLDYFDVLRRLLPRLLQRTADPATLAQQATVEAALALTIARRQPERIERITEQLADGRLTVRTHAFSDPSDRAWIAGVVADGVSGILAAVLLGIAAWLITADGGPVIGTSLSLFDLLGAASGIAGAALAFRLLVRLFRR